MDQIQISAKFPNIASENLASFKETANAAIEATKTEDGAVNYDYFFNADETACVVRETYASSDAVLAHLGNVGEQLGPLVEMGGGLEVEIFGNPSDELVEATAQFAPAVHSHFGGI